MSKLLCVLSLFVMLSCSQTGNSEMSAPAEEVYDEAVATYTDPHAPPSEDQQQKIPTVPIRKLIRNGTMSFEVENVEDTRKGITALAIELGGYISAEKQGKLGDDPRHEQVVRIPGNQFDAFVTSIEGFAKQIDDKNFTVLDVTEDYVDLESRLVAKKELEVRFREIVRSAKTIEEILDVENEIGTVRTEIEQIQGKLKYLSNRVAYSTIALTFYENSPVIIPGTASKFAESFFDGWNSMVAFLIVLTRTWPFLLTFVAIIWLLRKKNALRALWR